jgi:uncharacterized protein YjbI with pentapeptide repeats
MRVRNPWKYARAPRSLEGLLRGGMLRDASGLSFEEESFQGLLKMDFDDASLSRTKLLRCEIVSMAGANAMGATFRDCVLDGVVFRGANLKHTKFNGCSLRNVYFEGADMHDTVFQLCDLTGVSFKRIDMGKLKLKNCRLNDASFNLSVMSKAFVEEMRAQGIYVGGESA